MIDSFRIARGGRLLCDRWNSDERKREKGVDITDYIVYHLTDECTVEDGVTVGDIISLVEDKKDFLSPLLTQGRDWLHQIIDESKIDGGEQTLDKLYIGWRISIQDDIYTDNTHLIEYTTIHATKDGIDDTYAVDFTPANKLVNLPIVLNETVSLTDERKSETRVDAINFPLIYEGTKKFTLLDILHALFYEMTFHGPPADREKRKAELEETMRRISSGEEKTIPWEEVKERLKNEIDS